MMFNHHPALLKTLQQDRYYRLLNDRRRGAGNAKAKAIAADNDSSAPPAPKVR